MAELARRLAAILPTYSKIAWWGLVEPRFSGREPLVVYQGIVHSGRRVLLSVRSDLRGWELPGGNPRAGESGVAVLTREIREETGIEVAIERWVGDYVRTGFRPHTARVYACRPLAGELRPSTETPVVRWFDRGAIPSTLFPWYRAPLADWLSGRSEPVERREHQGAGWVLAAMAIDLRMRLSADRAS